MSNWPITVLFCATLAIGAPAYAQTESNELDRSLEELSSVLGKAHAIHVQCNGLVDQYWRESMTRLLDLEASQKRALKNRLIDRFNSAFAEQEESISECDDDAELAFDALTIRGRSLAESINANISSQAE